MRNNSTIFDYDINSDPVALGVRWFFTKFVFWFFGPLAVIGVCFYLYCVFTCPVPRGVERAKREAEETEVRIKKVENYFKY